MTKPPISSPADALIDEPDARLEILDTPTAGPATIRGGALRTAAYVAGLLLSLASIPFLVRHLGVVDFGRYVLITTLAALANGLAEGGLGFVAQREYVLKDGAERDAHMSELLGLRLLLSAAAVTGATAFAAIAGYGGAAVIGTVVAGLALATQAVQNLLAVSLTSELRFGWVTAVEFLRQTFTVLVIVALILAGAELLPFLWGLLVAGTAALLLMAVLVRKVMPLRPTFNSKTWWSLLRAMAPYAAATAAYAAYFRVAVVLLPFVSSDRESGYFGTSYRIIEVFLTIPGLLMAAVLPVLARAAASEGGRLRHLVQRIFETALILGVWFALVILLGAELMIDVVAGDQSRASVPVLRIQAVAIVATFVGLGCFFPLLALRKHRELLLSTLAALTLTVPLTLLLGGPLGARGAAVATVVAEVVLGVTAASFLVHARADIRLSVHSVPAVALAAAAAAATLFVPVHDAVRVVLATAIYFGILGALRRLPPEVGQALLRRGQPNSD